MNRIIIENNMKRVLQSYKPVDRYVYFFIFILCKCFFFVRMVKDQRLSSNIFQMNQSGKTALSDRIKSAPNFGYTNQKVNFIFYTKHRLLMNGFYSISRFNHEIFTQVQLYSIWNTL